MFGKRRMNGIPKTSPVDRRGVQPGNIFGAAPVAAACIGGDAAPVNNSAAASQPAAALRGSRRGPGNSDSSKASRDAESSRASRDAPPTRRICHVGAPETIRPAGKPAARREAIVGSESFFMTRESRSGSEPKMNERTGSEKAQRSLSPDGATGQTRQLAASAHSCSRRASVLDNQRDRRDLREPAPEPPLAYLRSCERHSATQ